MFNVWSSMLDMSGMQCRFRVQTALEPPNHPGAIQATDGIRPDTWIDIHYTLVGMVIRCHVQSKPDSTGHVKVLPVKPDGSTSHMAEIQLADIGVIPYTIPGHIRRWNQDTYATLVSPEC